MSTQVAPAQDSLDAVERQNATCRCEHCGNTFKPRFRGENFCCSGCRVVHEMIQAGGLSSFYHLLGKTVLEPVSHPEPSQDQLDEIAEAAHLAEAQETSGDHSACLTLRVGNLSCTACIWLIDRLFQKYEGALRMNSNTALSTLTIWWQPGAFEVSDFVRDLHRFGYPAALVDLSEEGPPDESRSLLTRLGVTAGLALNTMVFTLPTYLGMETDDRLARLFMLVAFGSASLALAVGGSYFFQRAYSVLKLGTLHMDVPISLGLMAAYLGSFAGLILNIEGMLYFDFVATFTFLMLGGRWLHLRLLERNQRQLWAREKDLTSVFKIDDRGNRHRVPLRRIRENDRLEIPAEALLPVDATLTSASARFHLDWINGEPDAVQFHRGQRLRAGSRNASGRPIEVAASEAFAGSFLNRLFEPSHSTEADHTTDHPVLRIYLISVLVLAALGGTGWLIWGDSSAAALQVAISILVVSCPCALGLALPMVDEILLSKLRREGIFIRNHSLWRRLGQIHTLIFDKTGTLTEPIKQLNDPEQIGSLSSEEREALQWLTQQNTHPVGRALHDIITSRYGILEKEAPKVNDHPGFGVSIEENGETWKLGRGDWATQDHRHSNRICTLSRNDAAITEFELKESIRDGAHEQITQLSERGFDIRILSGDPDATRVQTTAAKLGLNSQHIYADMSPEEKARHIAAQPTESVLFVGDGGNDSLALEAAAASGSPATGIRAIESRADFVFTGRGFHAISRLFDSSNRRHRIIVSVFATAIAYNLIAIGLCLAGLMNPLLAAVLMPISSIVTTAIAARV